MTDAQSPAKLSAPTRSNSSTKEAVEALPEKGRVSKSGKSSAGTPMALTMGESSFDSSSIAPDAFSIEIPTISAHSVGKRLTAVCNPSLAPTRKDSKRSFLPSKRRAPTAARMRGIGSAEMRSIICFWSTCTRKTPTYAQKRGQKQRKSYTQKGSDPNGDHNTKGIGRARRTSQSQQIGRHEGKGSRTQNG